MSQEQLDGDWTADAVEPLAKLVSDIGDFVEDTCSLIEQAKHNDVGIRNDAALRYEVPYAVWQSGVGISQWVVEAYDKLANTPGREPALDQRYLNDTIRELRQNFGARHVRERHQPVGEDDW